MKAFLLAIVFFQSVALFGWSRLLYRPVNNIREVIMEAIKREKKRIRLSVYILSDKKITNALLEAIERGVEFEAIFDETTLEASFGKGQYLLEHGVCFHCFRPNKKGFFKPLMHTKFITFAGQDEGQMLFSGSCNFTQSGFERNVEVMEQTNDPDRVAEFDRLFEYLKTLPTVHLVQPQDFL